MGGGFCLWKHGNFPFVSSASGKGDTDPFCQLCMADGSCVDLIRCCRCDPWNGGWCQKGKPGRPGDICLCPGHSQYTGFLGGSGTPYGVCGVVKSPSCGIECSNRRRCGRCFHSRPYPSWHIAGSGFKPYRYF